MTHEEFEKIVMDKLLFGENEVLETLRKQYQSSTIESREFDGVGFFTHFKVDEKLKLKGKSHFTIGDLHGKYEIDRYNDVGFVLFIRDGIITTLEGFTYGDEWISDYDSVKLEYSNIIERNLGEYKTIPKDKNNLKPVLLKKNNKVYSSCNNKVAILKLDNFNTERIIEKTYKICDILDIQNKDLVLIISESEIDCVDLNGNIIWNQSTDFIESYYIDTENNCIVIKTERKIQKFSLESGKYIYVKDISYMY